MNMSLNNVIPRLVNGFQLRLSQPIRMMKLRPRRKRGRRRRLRLRLMDLRKATMFNSVSVLRTRVVLENLQMHLTCTKFVQRR
jgi:hypothetical protein